MEKEIIFLIMAGIMLINILWQDYKSEKSRHNRSKRIIQMDINLLEMELRK